MKIGVIVVAATGHTNPSSSLAKTLNERQDVEVVFVSSAKARAAAEQWGLEFQCIGDDATQQEFDQLELALSQHDGFEGLKCALAMLEKMNQAIQTYLPDILSKQKFDALLIDETLLAARSVAELAKIPFSILCITIPSVHSDSMTPPFFTTWQPPHPYDIVSRSCITILYHVMDKLVFAPIVRCDNEWRKQHSLPKIDSKGRLAAPRFWVTMIPEALDFPRAYTPPNLFYTGMWSRRDRDNKGSIHDNFPWDTLNRNVPLIYASLGTLQNGIRDVYIKIAQACQEIGSVQLVIALGRKGATLELPTELSNNTSGILVVDYAPQMALLPLASIVVTHSGLNTVLESLGLPMVSIPLANDQPGTAARMVRKGFSILVQNRTFRILNRPFFEH